MLIQIDRAALVAALARVQGVLVRGGPVEATSLVLLEASTDGLRVAATDLDVTIDGRAPCEVERTGAVTVDGKRLYDVARGLSAGAVTLDVNAEHHVAVRCGRASYDLLGIGPASYPVLPAMADADVRPIDGLALRSLVEGVAFSVSSDASRPNLTGAFVRTLDDGRLRMVSTDGHRLSMVEGAAWGDDAPAGEDGVIVPAKGLAAIRRMVGDVGGDLRMGRLDNTLVLAGGDVSLAVRLLDAAFPDYRQVIPKSNGDVVTVDRVALGDAIKRLLVIASERTYGLRLVVEAGEVVITADTPDVGTAREVIACEGGAASVGTARALNARYIRDILDALGCERVRLCLGEPLAPVVLRPEGDDDAVFVVMPMRL
jgi:DNA polymerase-3 subunit beta